MDGDDGGGFLPPGAGGRTGFSPTGDTPKKGKGRNQPLVPLTVKQILAAQQVGEEDEFQLDGRIFSQASIVGQILSVNKNAAFYAFTIDDSTGQLDVRCWVDQEDPNHPQTQRLAALEQGAYVRAVGSLRAFGDKKNMIAFRLIEIRDFNELTFHNLEVIYQHLSAQRASAPQHGAWAQPAKTGQFMPAAPAPSVAAVNPYARAPTAADAGMNPLQQEIVRYLRTSASPEDSTGVSLSAVLAATRSLANEDQVRRELQKLQDDGTIFTTIDEEHFAYTGDA